MRGEIKWVDFTRGAEGTEFSGRYRGETHPALVVSSNRSHEGSRYVTVIPLTSPYKEKDLSDYEKEQLTLMRQGEIPFSVAARIKDDKGAGDWYLRSGERGLDVHSICICSHLRTVCADHQRKDPGEIRDKAGRLVNEIDWRERRTALATELLLARVDLNLQAVISPTLLEPQPSIPEAPASSRLSGLSLKYRSGDVFGTTLPPENKPSMALVVSAPGLDVVRGATLKQVTIVALVPEESVIGIIINSDDRDRDPRYVFVTPGTSKLVALCQTIFTINYEQVPNARPPRPVGPIEERVSAELMAKVCSGIRWHLGLP
jgi:mRNA-degrading endonuclease toxin of MazEF toxin-antitoxin module